MGSINIIVTIFNMRAPGMTMMKLPLVRVGLADHRLPADRHTAGTGRCGHHAADRSSFRNPLLRRRRWRRPDPFPAPVLVLRPSGGLHPAAAGLGSDPARTVDLLAQADLWLQGTGLQLHRHRPALSHCLGASFLYRRAASARADLLHVQHNGDFRAAGRTVLLLDRDHVARRDDLRDADAVCHRFYRSVRDRRADRVDPRRRGWPTPSTITAISSSPTSTTPCSPAASWA